MTGAPIRIVLADDQPLFSAGLKMILRSQADMDLVGDAVNGEAAVTLAHETRPDVLLMDIRMPAMDGITATKRILESPAHASTKIIVLTTIQHDEAVVRAIQAGAAGFLTKDTTPEFLLAAIRTVHSGHSVIAPALTNELLRDYTTPSAGNEGAQERRWLLHDGSRRHGRTSPEGFWLDPCNYAQMKDSVVGPLSFKSRPHASGSRLGGPELQYDPHLVRFRPPGKGPRRSTPRTAKLSCGLTAIND